MFVAKLLVALALVLATPLSAQPTADVFLQTAILWVRDTVKRLPAYVCSASIEHTEIVAPRLVNSCAEPYGLPGLANWSDRLHVELLAAAGDEAYSWSSDEDFQNRDVFEAVRSRRSSGGFSGFLESIFVDERTQFGYRGEVQEGSRRLRQYVFQVQESRSTFWFDRQDKRVTLAFDGTALFDAGTADLVRIRLHAAEPVDLTGACKAVAIIDYVRAPIQNTEFLLPAHVQTEARDTLGWSFGTDATLTDCRAFSGDSSKGSTAPAGLPTLAANSSFAIVFTKDIDYTKAAAGDMIEARLVTPILDSAKQIAVPAGTPVIGRILKLSWMQNTPPPFRQGMPGPVAVRMNFQVGAALVYQLESLVIGGVARPFRAIPALKLDSQDPMDRGTLRLIELPPPGGFRRGSSEAMVAQENVALIKVRDPKGNLIVKAGHQSKWKTAPAVR